MAKKILTKEEVIEKRRREDAERAELLMQADEIKEQTFDFDINGQVVFKTEVDELLQQPIDDPKEKYDLFYNVIERYLRRYLPKGDKNAKIRKWIRDEKCVFLTRGHRKDKRGRRHADSRMAYTPDMYELVNLLTEWIASRGTAFALYTKLRELNFSKGYGVPIL